MNFKKILKIIITILTLILIVLLFLIWRERNNKTSNINSASTGLLRENIQQNNSASAIKNLNANPGAKLSKISPGPVLGVKIINEKLVFFDQSTGYMYESLTDGSNAKIIKQEKIPYLTTVSWAPDNKQAILTTDTQQYYYNYNTNQVLKVDFGNEFAWSPQSDKIAFVCESGICLSDPDNYNKQTLYPTNLKELQISWPSEHIFFWQKPSFFAPGVLYSFNPGNPSSLQKNYNERYGVEFLPFGQKNILASVKGRLFVNDLDVQINALSHKCFWQNENKIYCPGVDAWPENKKMPDAYYQAQFSPNDALWEIDLKQNTKTEIYRTGYDMQNLIIYQNKAFFTDKNTGYLYLLKLK